MTKARLYLFGLVTLLLFPLPIVVWKLGFTEVSINDLFEFDNFNPYPILLGYIIGALYAYFALIFMKMDFGAEMPVNIERLIRKMKLNVVDCLFISFCAGFGEEILFRAGIQDFLGPIITSIIFVAIHGYLNPFNWRISIYGLIVLPFILLLAYGLEEFGLWFCISAHFAYDFILFRIISEE